MTRRSTTRRWVKEKSKDVFVRKRRAQGLRSRAVFKLEDIIRRERLVSPGARILDLGASPGGWTQVAVDAAGSSGMVLAVDVLPMVDVPGAGFIRGDCREPEVVDGISAYFHGRRVGLVFSDMAPNITGIRVVDDANCLQLAKTVITICERFLEPGGALVIKLFESPDIRRYCDGLAHHFGSIRHHKPPASRSASREFYIVAREFGIVLDARR